MKKLTDKGKLLVIVGAMFLVLPAISHATPWLQGEDLTISLLSEYSVWSGISGYGGLFEITNTSRGETVYGFCVELDEWMLSPSKVYDADDDVVWKGGRNTDSGDELSGATQWLYWKYLTDPAYQTTDAVKAIQLAIWYLEEEYYDKGAPDSWKDWYISVGGDGGLAGQAVAYIAQALSHNTFQSDQILALDVYDGNETGQRQSYIYKVPEPLTITMLGLGLVGFAIATRLKMRKP